MDSSYSDTGSLAILAALGFFFFLIAVAFYVIGSWFLMKIFDKAGVQGRWRAWVPVYNLLVFAKLGDLSPWVMLIAIAAGALLSGIPVLGVIIGLVPLAAGAMAAWRVGQKLQKETPWVILYIFLSIRPHDLFQRDVGVTPARFHARARIALGKRQLIYSDASVTEIAMGLGYSSSQYFATSFKRIVGLTPADYRRLREKHLGPQMV